MIDLIVVMILIMLIMLIIDWLVNAIVQEKKIASAQLVYEVIAQWPKQHIQYIKPPNSSTPHQIIIEYLTRFTKIFQHCHLQAELLKLDKSFQHWPKNKINVVQDKINKNTFLKLIIPSTTNRS